MKVLQLISTRGFFGAENVVVELAAALRSSGNPAIVGAFRNRHAGPDASFELLERAKTRGLETKAFECGGRIDLRTVGEIRRFAQERGIDVIHSHGYKSNIYAYLANRKLKCRLVTTCHNWINASSKMSFYTRLDKFFLRRFDAVAAVSADVRDQLIASGVDPGKLRVINNGVDLEKFRKRPSDNTETRRSLGIPPGAFVAGTVGRLSPEKGLRFLLEAAREVCGKKENCFFLIVGDGPEKSGLEEQAKSLGIEKRVVFAGVRTDIPEMLSAMDVFVMPSLTEGQPMALLEAMAAGKPSVATSVGGMPAILGNGACGVVVPPSDSARLSEGILRVLEDRRLYRELSESAQKAVEEQYSSITMAATYRACYEG